MTNLRIGTVLLGVVVVICANGCFETDQAKTPTPQHLPQQANPPQQASTEFSSRERLTNSQVLELAKQHQLERLEVYDASEVDSQSWTTVLSSLPELRRLRIEQGAVSDEVLASIGGLEKLEVLNVPHGDFTNAGLTKVLSLPKLMLLRIGSSKVTDDGFKGIARAKALRFVHLLNVPISDDGLAAFHNMDQLESFYIDNGTETEDGIRELLKKQPRLHFHRNQLHVAEDPNSDGH